MAMKKSSICILNACYKSYKMYAFPIIINKVPEENSGLATTEI